MHFRLMPKSSSLDTHSIAKKNKRRVRLLEPNTKIFMKIYPYTISGKMGEWSRMQHHFSDILSSDTKTGDLERRMWVFNVRKVDRPCTLEAHVRCAF